MEKYLYSLASHSGCKLSGLNNTIQIIYKRDKVRYMDMAKLSEKGISCWLILAEFLKLDINVLREKISIGEIKSTDLIEALKYFSNKLSS